MRGISGRRRRHLGERIGARHAAMPRRRGGTALLTVALTATGLLVATHGQPPAPPRPATGTLVLAPLTPPPVRPAVQRVALPGGGRATALRLVPRRTRHFSLVGITWTDSRAALGADVEIRTRAAATGTWRDWSPLPADDDLPDDAGPVRGGTAPSWVGDSDGIEIRTRGAVSGRLPAGLRLDLVDPGTAPSGTAPSGTAPSGARGGERIAPVALTAADAAPSGTPRTARATDAGTTATSTSTSVSTTVTTTVTTPTTPGTATEPAAGPTTSPTGTRPTTTTSTTTTSTTTTPPGTTTPTSPTTTTTSPTTPSTPPESAPAMVRRASWSADEGMRASAPQYASAVRVVFVHHTATTNAYSCNDSAAIVRSLYAYHTLSLGWNDIGYNFLVDRCGTVFEGRYGGASRPVIGAHTYGFNTNSAGIAVIGTYTSTGAPSEVLSAVARLAGWKLSLASVAPTGISHLVEAASDSRGFLSGRTYAFHAVSGHRDGYATECPGRSLYAQLPLVRGLAAANGGSTGQIVSVDGAAAAGGRYYTTGRVTVTWSAGAPASGVASYTVLVDGAAVATTGPDTRSATLTLTPGTHRVTVRTAYLPSPAPPSTTTSTTSPGGTAPSTTTSITTSITGTTTTTSSPPATTDSPAVTVVSDVTPPVFGSAPRLGLRGGTVNLTGTPVSLGWRATDDTYLARVTATSPTRATFTPATTSWATTAGPGDRTFALTAVDGAGNSRAAAVTGRATLIPEASATRSGAWSTVRNAVHIGAAAYTSSAPNSSLTWTFTGTSVAWVADRTPTAGQAVVYLDGVRAAAVNLRAARPAYRQSVWVRNGLAAGPHTVRVVVVGSTGRRPVTTDGIVHLS